MEVRIVESVPLLARMRADAVEAARELYHAPGRVAFRQRLRRIRVAETDSMRLSFGWLDEPLRAGEARIGGGVKLAHLRERFGESREEFNILYLVSSVLHLVPHVEELVAWAKRQGGIVVWNQNGVAYPAWCGSNYPWFNAPMRRLRAQADYIIYQSEFCRACADRYLGPCEVSGEVLWNPVDVQAFSPAASVPPPHVWQLLAMGTNHSFYRVKSSLETLAELMRRGISARLTIAGEMRWKDGDREVDEFIERERLRDYVQLLPPFSQAEAPEIYRRAHVLLHPKYKDPCPTVPIEAMACGIPVVGSRSGGMPELVPAAVGRLAEVPEDWTRDHSPAPEAFADAVCEIMADHAAFSRAARAWAEASFDRKKWVDRHGTLFTRFLQEHER